MVEEPSVFRREDRIDEDRGDRLVSDEDPVLSVDAGEQTAVRGMDLGALWQRPRGLKVDRREAAARGQQGQGDQKQANPLHYFRVDARKTLLEAVPPEAGLFAEGFAQAHESAVQQARDVHLGDAESIGDLGLSHAPVETEEQDLALALWKLGHLRGK